MRWKIGSCEFDSLTREIIPNAGAAIGQPEASVLEILIKYFDKKRTHAQIASEAWGEFKSPDSLYKAIQNLRKAFGGEKESFIARGPYRLVVKPEPIIDGEDLSDKTPIHSLGEPLQQGPLKAQGLPRSFLLTREEINDVVGSVEDRLRTASEEIWISGNDNMFVAKSLSPSVVKALKNNRRIRLLGVDPKSDAASMLSIIDPRFEGGTFKREVDFVTEVAHDWHREYPNFEYRLLSILPAVGYFITDPKLASRTVKIELYTARPWEPFDSRPHLVIDESMPEWREYFIQQFQNYWDLSKTPW